MVIVKSYLNHKYNNKIIEKEKNVSKKVEKNIKLWKKTARKIDILRKIKLIRL